MAVDGPERTDGGLGSAGSPVPGGAGGHQQGALGWFSPTRDSRSRRSLIRLLGAAAIASAFTIGLGLLIAVLTSGVGKDTSDPKSVPPALALTTAPAPLVPSDWVQQTASSGIVFRSPPGWTQRTDALVDFRVQPGPNGAPGVEQIGLGISSAADPDTAATSYATNTYGGQPNFLQQPSTDEVSARGERGRQTVITYTREGTPVQAVIRAFPTPRGMLVEVSRAGADDQTRAGQLATQLDASVRLS